MDPTAPAPDAAPAAAPAATPDWKAKLDQIANLSDDDLQALEQELVDAFDTADQANDETQLTDIADALDQVRTEIGQRSSAPAASPVAASAEEQEEEVAPEAEVEAEAPVDTAEAEEETPAPEADTTPTAPEEGTAVAASTVVTEAPQVPEDHAPVVASAMTAVTAGADIPGFSAGTKLNNIEEFGKAMASRINTLRSAAGTGEKVIVASIASAVTDQDRILHHNDPEGNRAKIEALTHRDALTAAGGACAPLVTKYDLWDNGGVTDRPVKDALAGFQADRGGLRFWPAPLLADMTGAVGFWTNEDDTDALESDGPVKVTTRIECPQEITAEVQAITMSITFGVLQNRVFPELAVANNKLALIAQARIAESALLAQIKAGSVAITDGGTALSATRDLLSIIGRAAIYYRDRYRLNKDASLRVIFPAWVLETLRGDIAVGLPVGGFRQTFSTSDADIEGFFSDRNINVTWALDSSDPVTNTGGFYAGVTAATIPAWQTSVQWAMYPEGAWLFLDGGSLDLGIIRDSALVRTNDYMQFAESWEAAAKLGGESFWITSAIDVSGKFQGPITPTT
jgi:hypothetical protein